MHPIIIKYRLRLLAADRVNIISENGKLIAEENLPLEVTIEATHVNISDGIAHFMINDELMTALSLNSFLWSPFGNTPENIRMTNFPMREFGSLHSHDFSYSIIVCAISGKNMTSEAEISDDGKTLTSYRYENIRIGKSANAVIMHNGIFYFVNSDGKYLYSAPADRSYFEPLGGYMVNFRVWNVFPDTKIEVIQKTIEGGAGFTENYNVSLQDSSGTSGSSGTSYNGSSGSSGVDGSSGFSGSSGVSGTVLRWQGAWDFTTAYKIDDVVRDDNGVWIAIKDNKGARPSQNPFGWDLMIGNSGDAQLNSMKISLTPKEISTLKKSHLVIYIPDGRKLIEVISASLVFYPKEVITTESHNLAICMGNNVIGGWSNPFLAKEIIVDKATMLEDYKYSPKDSLILKADKDFAATDSSAVIFISYRLLPL